MLTSEQRIEILVIPSLPIKGKINKAVVSRL